MCDLEVRDHLQEIGVNGKIIPKWIFKKLVGTWDWILGLDKDRWRVHVKSVMNFRVP